MTNIAWCIFFITAWLFAQRGAESAVRAFVVLTSLAIVFDAKVYW